MTTDYNDLIRALREDPISPVKRRKRQTLNDLPRELRGLPNNRWGGHKCRSMRGFKNNTYGPASAVKRFSPEECANWEKEWRSREQPIAQGVLSINKINRTKRRYAR